MFNVRIATINSVAVILSSIMIAGTILIAGWFYSAFPILDSCVMISLLGSLPVLISGGVIWYTFDTLDAVSSATKITRSMDLRELKGQFSVLIFNFMACIRYYLTVSFDSYTTALDCRTINISQASSQPSCLSPLQRCC